LINYEDAARHYETINRSLDLDEVLTLMWTRSAHADSRIMMRQAFILIEDGQEGEPKYIFQIEGGARLQYQL